MNARTPSAARGADLPAVRIRTVVELRGQHEPHAVHPAGTQGTLVEVLGPDCHLVELRVSDESLVGGAWYDVLDVRPEQYEQYEENAGT